jgi:signal transduction histidine kinase/ligand-binding sensor domain-containing protein
VHPYTNARVSSMSSVGASGSNPAGLVTRAWRPAAILPALVLVCCTCAFSLDPSLDINQYAHTSWKSRDGFLKAAVYAIAQTPDGYLWLGTDSGLLRFDGVRAVPWRPSSDRQFPSNGVLALLAARDGTLWIGTSKGLASWKAGKFIEYPQLAGMFVRTLLEDHEGTVWAGGFAYTPPGTLCAIRNGSIRCSGDDGTFGNGVLGLFEDRHRRLWAGVLNGFWQWEPGPPHFYAVAGQSYGIHSFAEDRDGALLIPIGDSFARLSHGKIETAHFVPGAAHVASGQRILRDRDGALWIGTWSQGLVHLVERGSDTFSRRDGLSGDVVSALFEDREGNIWVATTKGLDRFRAYSVATFTERQGLSSSGSASAIAARDGSIWFSPNGRLYRFERGQVTIYHQPGGGIEPNQEEAERRVREVSVAGLPELGVASLFQDTDGRIWIAATGGVGYLQNDRFVLVDSIPGGVADAMADDAKGNLWISIVNRGLFHVFRDKLVQHIPWAVLGRNDLATALAVDPSRGGVWLGFSKGGLAWLAEGGTRASFVGDAALEQGRVSDLRFDHDGALWVASDTGLSRRKDGRVSTLTTKNGLPCNEIYWLAEDEDHSFWLFGSCGLIRIARSDLEASLATTVSANPKSVGATLFDETDGVILQVNLSAMPGPRGVISPDGRLWFPTQDGLSVIDPHHLPFNKLPPPVRIERIVSDDKEYDISDRLRLPARVRDLSIDFTALSLAVPEKVRFRYRLEEVDQDWKDAGTRREAFYTRLGPGKYHFQVIACNNDGVWNEEGAHLDFNIAPAWYQTIWFRTLWAITFLALLWTVYQLRLHQLRRQFNIKFEERVGERTRIARELHDTLLQSFHGLLMRFQAVSNELDDGEPKRELDETIDQAARAITEGRDAVQELRSSVVESNDVAAAIGNLGKELAAAVSRPPEFTLQAEGLQRSLHPILRDEVYRVAGEALRNAFRHADARRIEVEIRYDEGQFRLRVRDDGKGMDPNLLVGDGRAGHFGLRGMRERAERAGGTLTVWSELKSGTEVELSIPAAHAYTRVHAPHRLRWLAEKIFGKDHEVKS